MSIIIFSTYNLICNILAPCSDRRKMRDKREIMEKPDTDRQLPSYEQSIASPHTNNSPANNQDTSSSPIEARRRETRTRRINNLLTTHIEPTLQFRLLDDGITGRLVFIILPSDILTEQRQGLTSKNVVSSSTASPSEIAGLIRLEGDEHRIAFWQQEVVIADLAGSLRTWMAGYGYRVENDNNKDDGNGDVASGKAGTTGKSSAKAGAADAVNGGQGKEKSQFRRKKSSGNTTSSIADCTPVPPYDRIAITSYKLGWRADEEDSVSRRKLDPDEVRVLSRMKDVSFRAESLLGLYQTVTEKVVWLQVEIGV